MVQSYSAIAPCIRIPRHSPLFNHPLTFHALQGRTFGTQSGRYSATPAQLRKCRVTIRHATSWLSVRCSARPSAVGGDYRKAVSLSIARHLRSCAGISTIKRDACQRYAPYRAVRCCKVTAPSLLVFAFRAIPRFLTTP